jgi:transposase-like protein
MKTRSIAPDYTCFRFPPEMMSHAVWLYVRFSLSVRDVEERPAQRGIVVPSETVRQWCLKCGQVSVVSANVMCTGITRGLAIQIGAMTRQQVRLAP